MTGNGNKCLINYRELLALWPALVDNRPLMVTGKKNTARKGLGRGLDFSGLKTVSLAGRKSKVHIKDLVAPPPDHGFMDFARSIPGLLKGGDFLSLVRDLRRLKRLKRPIIWMMGSHVIKCGLSDLVIDLAERGIISMIAINGSGVIHDLELALAGKTSEDVAESLKDGSFGMVRETCDAINLALEQGVPDGLGFGAAVGDAINRGKYRWRRHSILAMARRAGVPVSVHVAVGTDILHPHPRTDGALIGKASLRDFHAFCEMLSTFDSGGAVLNIGSAVILPEVFLKAMSTVRNLGYSPDGLVTANFDMIMHYRPMENVVRRPVIGCGRGYSFTGHHEIMVPLLCWGLKQKGRV